LDRIRLFSVWGVNPLAHFAIVSGSETSCGAWNHVLERLRELGHTCRIHGLDEISWTHGVEAPIQDLADRIGCDNETILVGHSIAGLFLPSIGEALGASSQVYIAALIPQPGKSVFDQLLMNEEIFFRSWTEGYEAMRRSKDPLISHRSFLEWHLFHDCPSQSIEQYWIQTDLPLRKIYETPYPAPNSMKSCHFIVCTGDRTLQPRAQRLSAQRLPCASVSEIDTGHCPHIAAPAELADLIHSLTGNAHCGSGCQA
jgi:pimeloyl-ACP methyl ester carboxylesterase